MATPLTALIIDDEPLARQELLFLLDAAGDVSVLAQGTNGIEAVELIRTHKPDVIFLDLSMPVMDGWEFMKEYAEIKSQLGKKISIYVLSSSTDASDIDRAKNISDIADYIFKPVDGQRLTEIFNDLQGIARQ